MRPMDRLIARLDHAWEQRQMLYTEATEFLDTEPYRMGKKRNPNTGEQVIWVKPTSPVPLRLGFLTGDCINNIRSCLDNMVSALPGADMEKTAFVILETDPATEPKSPTFEQKTSRRLKGIPDAARDIIKSLQPYQRTQDSSRADIPIGTLLLRLERLWNSDKYRSSLVAMSATQAVVVNISRPWLVATDLNTDTFDGCHVLFRLRAGDIGDGEAKVKVHVSIDIALNERPLAERPFSGENAAMSLTNFYNCVRYDVLPLFEQWL